MAVFSGMVVFNASLESPFLIKNSQLHFGTIRELPDKTLLGLSVDARKQGYLEILGIACKSCSRTWFTGGMLPVKH